MDNEHMKTSEVELRMLIEESKSLIDKNQLMIAKGEATLSKMNKTLKGFVATAIPIVLAFFWTFYDNGRTMARIEESSLSKTEAADKYATKADVVFFQNNIYDMNNSSFIFKQYADEEKIERMYTKALKQFVGDVTRGEPNQQ